MTQGEATEGNGKAPCPVPAHDVALAVIALAAVLLAHHASAAYHASAEAGKFPAEVRRPIVFGLVFSGVVLPALVIAWLGDLVAGVVALVRCGYATFGWFLGRFAAACLPLVVFLGGHLILNHWLLDLVRQLPSLVGE